MLLKRRSGVEPPPPPRSSEFLVKIPFEASFQSKNSIKNHKNFRKLVVTFGGLRSPKVEVPPNPTLVEKILGVDTKNCREQGFHSVGHMRKESH